MMQTGRINKYYRLFILLILSVLLGGTALAPLKALAAPEDQKVYDNYGLFSSEEVADLEDICSKYGDEGKIDIVMITDDFSDKSRQEYLEDFYDEHGFGFDKEFGDTAMILINMNQDDRGVEIQGYGNAEYYLNNDRIEHMLDDVVALLKDGSYYDAMDEFAKQAAYYMNQDKGVNTSPATGADDSGESGYTGPGNNYGGSGSNNYGESGYAGPSDYYGEKDDNIFYNTFFQVAIAVIIGAVAVGIMAANSGGRVTVSNRTYLDEGHSGIVATRDDYIRTTTTRVKKPTNDNNNGGGRSSGGGGISSGGHSHSGGGRSF
ncbi:TPM domain-containing protein [Anaerocolumna sp. AGMB13025]|uniref:TPM domain-containing protein n=1 Tax=Anaerocolumna sp. AGMB13025 TaxID=3039116 RepID=UPI00241D774B|nr:TPM domain-containing protein [Anaerocolumna sp. AGMB13025]WFR56938.1 TPM domain-containing protein [Anaerocolumna sp. AGMB13025]